MATKRAKAWFFTGPSTSAGVVFNKYNIPAFETMEDLMESVPLFLEIGSTASIASQGLVKLAADANVKARTSSEAGTMQSVVQPHQLPNVTAGLGIAVTEDVSGTAKHFAVAFDPTGLAAETYVPADDYIFFLDATDGLPKKTLFSTFVPDGFWEIVSATDPPKLGPTTDNSSVDIGSGILYTGGVMGNNVDNFYIGAIAEPLHAGTNIHLLGGSASHALTSYAGGNVYIYGGAGVNGGAYGSLVLQHDGSNYRNKTYVGGISTTVLVGSRTKILYVHGGIVANSFTLANMSVGPPEGSIISTMITANADGELISSARLTAMEFMFGTPTGAASLAHYDGSDWTMLDAVTEDTYLRVDAAGAFELVDLVLTGKIVNASVAAGAAIVYSKLALTNSILNADIGAAAAIVYSKLTLTNSIVNADIATGAAITYAKLTLTESLLNVDINASAAIAHSKMAALAASKIPVLSATGFLEASAIDASKLTYLDATSSIRTQLTNLATSSQGNGVAYKTSSFAVEDDLKSHYVMDITSANVEGELPALADLEDGDTFTFTKKFSAGSFAATVIANGGKGDSIKNATHGDVATLTIAGATLSSITLIKRDANYWELLSAIVAV